MSVIHTPELNSKTKKCRIVVCSKLSSSLQSERKVTISENNMLSPEVEVKFDRNRNVLFASLNEKYAVMKLKKETNHHNGEHDNGIVSRNEPHNMKKLKEDYFQYNKSLENGSQEINTHANTNDSEYGDKLRNFNLENIYNQNGSNTKHCADEDKQCEVSEHPVTGRSNVEDRNALEPDFQQYLVNRLKRKFNSSQSGDRLLNVTDPVVTRVKVEDETEQESGFTRLVSHVVSW